MRSLFYWLAVVLLAGCASGGYYYPGQVPKSCKVSDGYCYHRYISHDQMLVDVYIWTPKDGWKLHHTEKGE